MIELIKMRIRIALGLLVLTALVGCSDASDPRPLDFTPIVPAIPPVMLSGSVVKGPIAGARVVVTRADTGVVLAETTTNADGSYEIDIGGYTGVVIVTVSGGEYVDEATGVVTTLDTPLRAISVASDDEEIVHVTPLTEIAAQVASNSGSLSEEVVQEANAMVAKSFNIQGDIITTAPANLIDGSSPTEGSGEAEYGIALAAISQVLASDDTEAGLAAFLSDVSTDISVDGEINEQKIINDFVAAVEAFLESDMNQSGLEPEDSGLQSINTVPTVNAGLDQTVNEGQTVSLLGEGSDPEGPVAFSWRELSGFDVSLSASDQALAEFVAPATDSQVTLRFELTVTDGAGVSVTDEIFVTVDYVNTPPVVSAGEDDSIQEGETVAFTAVASDAEGGVSFQWVQVSGPAASLEGSESSELSVSAPAVDQASELVFRVTATDVDGATTSDEVMLSVAYINTPPFANAGSDQIVRESETVQLVGIGGDAEGVVSYHWTQIQGLPVDFTFVSPETISFQVPDIVEDSTFTFQLDVMDVDGFVSQDTVQVMASYINTEPKVSAGADQSVNEQTPVMLSAMASDEEGEVTYLWTQLSGESVSFDPVLADIIFTAPAISAPTNLVFSVTVTDHDGLTATDQVQVHVDYVNTSPMVTAGADQTVDEQTAVMLSAMASDEEGEVTYLWTQLSGESVSFDPALADISFTAPAISAPTDLVFSVTVTDTDGLTATDQVQVHVDYVNTSPMVSAGADQTVDEQTPVNLSAMASDEEGEVTYLWQQVSGEAVVLGGAETPSVSFTAPSVDAPTGLVFQVSVTDVDQAVSTDMVEVVVNYVNTPPEVSVGNRQEVLEQTQVNLVGMGTDAEGPVTYLWQQVSGPEVVLTVTDQSTSSFTAPDLTSQETLVFRLSVTDIDDAMVTADTSIVVDYVNTPPEVSAGADQQVLEQQPVTLTAMVSDDEGPLTVMWEQISGPAISLVDADTEQASFVTADSISDEIYTFKLSATDSDGVTVSDEISVTVLFDRVAEDIASALVLAQEMLALADALVLIPGEQGDQGVTGPKGDAGPQGDPGFNFTEFELMELETTIDDANYANPNLTPEVINSSYGAELDDFQLEIQALIDILDDIEVTVFDELEATP